MTSPKSYNLHAGILMTVLIGSAFVVHRHAEERCLAERSYASREAAVGEAGPQSDGGQFLAREARKGEHAP